LAGYGVPESEYPKISLQAHDGVSVGQQR